MTNEAPSPPRRTLLPVGGGEALSALVWDAAAPAGAPLLVFSHATGFNAATYRRLLAPLAVQLRIVALDQRGHGFSPATADPAAFHSWDRYRDDLLAVLEALGEPAILAGHSLGATVSLFAAAAAPGRVRGLALIDPVVLTRGQGLWLRTLKTLGLSHRLGLAAAAARRKAIWPDRAAMLAAWRGRGVFARWGEGFLEDYLDGGVRDRPDGQAELACAPAWEARSFSLTSTAVWRRLGAVQAPLRILKADRGSTLMGDSARRLARLRPDAVIERAEFLSHLMPMEDPARVGRFLLGAAERQMADGVSAKQVSQAVPPSPRAPLITP